MKLELEQRDIFIKEDLLFKDTMERDVKRKRPCLVIYVDSELKKYFLSCATHNDNVFETCQKYPDSTYLLKKKENANLKKTCLVELHTIYKESGDERCEVIVDSVIFEQLMAKFKKYQSKHPDSLYDEIKDLI